MNDVDPALPPIHVADIDRDKLGELFTDVEALGEQLEIVLKRGAEARVDAGPCASLAQAMELLTCGTVLGVQLRYRFEGADWWDTLMRTPTGFRLVRIQHPSATNEASASQESR